MSRSVRDIKTCITTTLLSHPQAEGQYRLYLTQTHPTKQYRAVLQQVQDGQEKVIAYMSKSLTGAEQRYCVTRKEMLTVITAFEDSNTTSMIEGLNFALTTQL